MKGLLKLTAIMAVALSLLSTPKPAHALVQGPIIYAYDCTDGVATCAGTYAGWEDILARLDNDVRGNLASVYSNAYSDYYVFYAATGPVPQSGISPNIYTIRLVTTQLTRNGVHVNAYHAQLPNGLVYAVVSTYGGLTYNQINNNMSRMVDEMIEDPHLNKPAGEVCPGTDTPVSYQASWTMNAYYGNVGVTPYNAPVCNFEINPGSDTWCSANPTQCPQ